MMEYIANVNTSVFPLGIIAKGEKLRQDHLDALGPDTIADMVERGMLTVTGDVPISKENMRDTADSGETGTDQAEDRGETTDNGDESCDIEDKPGSEDDSDEEDAEDQFDDEAEPPEIDIMDGVVQPVAEERPEKPTRKPAEKKQVGRRKKE